MTTSSENLPRHFTAIDDLTRRDHYHLTDADRCFFLGEYTSGAGFGHTNSLIGNFKKPVDRRGRPEWHYKEQAIARATGTGLAVQGRCSTTAPTFWTTSSTVWTRGLSSGRAPLEYALGSRHRDHRSGVPATEPGDQLVGRDASCCCPCTSEVIRPAVPPGGCGCVLPSAGRLSPAGEPWPRPTTMPSRIAPATRAPHRLR